MCGIVGYVGPDQALPIILEGLKRLEYRGYDSAGVALLDGGLTVVKRAGKLANLEAALDEVEVRPAVVGMGHTRWATHGVPNDTNAHPHLDCDGRVAVIHNGIIENFHDLRARLEKDGHGLVSDTDTECIAHLIEEHLADAGDLTEAVRRTVLELTGAYAVVALSRDEPGTVVGAKVSSPLVVGLGEGENLLASDIPAVLSRTRSVIPLEEGQIARLSADGVALIDFDGNELRREPIEIDWDVTQAQKSGFEDFMLKEIHEQPTAIRDTLVGRTTHTGRLMLDELRIDEDTLRDLNKVFVVACGTAFHAGLVAKYAIEHWTRLPVEIDIASEFRYRDPVLDANTLTLAVSQSGETIDTLEALRHACRQGSRVIAVTKTFATQMVALHLVALYLAQVRGSMFPEEIAEVVGRMHDLPEQVDLAIDLDDEVRELAAMYADARDVIFIGRHTGYPAALEGALKLKEISYIHAEGHPAGELKHGPIALLEEGLPVVAVATECHVYGKVLSNIQEVKARGAEVIAVATEGDQEIGKYADHVLFVPHTPELLAPVVVSVPLQILAYHVGKARGCDVDQPRNLAKTVTVE